MVECRLPLHQRLTMIKMRHGLSSRQALRVLAAEGGWFQTKWHNEVKVEGITDKTPNFRKTATEKIVASIQSMDVLTSRVVLIAPDVGLREFTFNGLLTNTSKQIKAYETVARKLVMDLMNGFNATCLMYGQTGSGKSYTMFGPDDAAIYGDNAQDRGIVPRACLEIFDAVESRERDFGINSSIGVSYVEVFGDQVSDLLRYGARCGQSKVSSQRFVLSGAAEQPISTMKDVERVLKVGEAQKRRAATAMNLRSTRAHAIFILSLTQTHVDKESGAKITRSSKLFLADLGGSEQVKKSNVNAGGHRIGAEASFSTGFEMGENMREAVYINLGLLALKKCIEAIQTGQLYVPYQDSKLTMLLSSGLGGDSKTSVVVCASMETEHMAETMASMRFGERCALIETEARNNASMLADVLADLDCKIAALEAEIQAKERWEVRQVLRTDELAEEGTLEAALGGKEVKVVTVLVGAQRERRELEALLRQRATLTGGDLFEDEEEATTECVSAGGGASVVAGGERRGRGKQVVGFGQEYRFGGRYDADADLQQENQRFEDTVDSAELPSVVKQRFAGKQWVSAPTADPAALAKKAKSLRRSKLVYSGMSAGGGL